MFFLMTEKNRITFDISEFREYNFMILYLLIKMSCVLSLILLTIFRDRLKNNMRISNELDRKKEHS